MAMPVTSAGCGFAYQSMPVTVGATLRLSGWYRADLAAPTGTYFRAAFDNGPLTDLLANGAMTTTWQQVSGTVTVPTGASVLVLELFGCPPGANTTEYWDGIAVLSS